MTTPCLEFTGPRDQARSELVGLLREFPRVYFVERDIAEYEVRTADAALLVELAAKPHWRLRPAAFDD